MSILILSLVYEQGSATYVYACRLWYIKLMVPTSVCWSIDTSAILFHNNALYCICVSILLMSCIFILGVRSNAIMTWNILNVGLQKCLQTSVRRLLPALPILRRSQSNLLNVDNEYKDLYRHSVEKPEDFFASISTGIDWFQPWKKIHETKYPFQRWYAIWICHLIHPSFSCPLYMSDSITEYCF